jgi:hypothetical protein
MDGKRLGLETKEMRVVQSFLYILNVHCNAALRKQQVHLRIFSYPIYKHKDNFHHQSMFD